jgi:hypothetical protein
VTNDGFFDNREAQIVNKSGDTPGASVGAQTPSGHMATAHFLGLSIFEAQPTREVGLLEADTILGHVPHHVLQSGLGREETQLRSSIVNRRNARGDPGPAGVRAVISFGARATFDYCIALSTRPWVGVVR